MTGGFNSIDRVFTMFALSDFATFSLRCMNSQALIMSVGELLDALGGYFILRFLIHDREGVREAIKVLGIVAIIMGIACSMSKYGSECLRVAWRHVEHP